MHVKHVTELCRARRQSRSTVPLKIVSAAKQRSRALSNTLGHGLILEIRQLHVSVDKGMFP
jgi:hypothetical protein